MYRSYSNIPTFKHLYTTKKSTKWMVQVWVMFDSFHAAHVFCCFLMFFIRSSLSGLRGPRRHCPCRHACHLLWTEVERASWFFNCGQIIIFHQPRFPWNNWIALTIRYLLFLFFRPCEVAVKFDQNLCGWTTGLFAKNLYRVDLESGKEHNKNHELVVVRSFFLQKAVNKHKNTK